VFPAYTGRRTTALEDRQNLITHRNANLDNQTSAMSTDAHPISSPFAGRGDEMWRCLEVGQEKREWEGAKSKSDPSKCNLARKEKIVATLSESRWFAPWNQLPHKHKSQRCGTNQTASNAILSGKSFYISHVQIRLLKLVEIIDISAARGKTCRGTSSRRGTSDDCRTRCSYCIRADSPSIPVCSAEADYLLVCR